MRHHNNRQTIGEECLARLWNPLFLRMPEEASAAVLTKVMLRSDRRTLWSPEQGYWRFNFIDDMPARVQWAVSSFMAQKTTR